ncbi:hypothetical protein MSEO_43580 [Mycobacterium seoulense]|uniref:Uncharacterized protein n=1 Tax=Mycobacterium seoulense TaxID=386911 RepID=A0A7I7P582_9MYCO|nr:hypothetical protein MSEO_43580 [Mycobacterium seoulense]
MITRDGAQQIAARDVLVAGFPGHRVFWIPVRDAMIAGHPIVTFRRLRCGNRHGAVHISRCPEGEFGWDPAAGGDLGAPNEGACPAVYFDAHIRDGNGSTQSGPNRLYVDYQLAGKSL